MRVVGRILSVIGVVVLILVLASLEGCVKYHGEDLGVYVLHELRGLHDAPAALDSSSSESTSGPSVETYASDRYGFSFKYLSPTYSVLDDQSQIAGSTLAGHDYVVLVAKPEDPTSSGLVVLVDTGKRFTKTADYWSHMDMASYAAFAYQKQMKKAGFAALLHKKVRVGNRRGYWQMMTGKVEGKGRVFMAYFVATDEGLYTITYAAPRDDNAAKWKRECDSLVQSFSFQ